MDYSIEEKFVKTFIRKSRQERLLYELSTPELLKKNYEDYKKVLAGEVSVM